jgi:prepilin-type processing-associated H-X9-DG protein
VQDHETLGVLGVNLIYGAMCLHEDPESLLRSLLDQLYSELVEIDMIEFSGPAFEKVDNRLMALRLVQHGLSNATMFMADGHVAQISDALYKKAILLERSRFRPPTNFTLDLLDCAQKAFIEDTDVSEGELMELSEMTLVNLSEDGDEINVNDFLNRADILCALGKNVLISNYGEYYRLAQFLFRYTNRPIALTMGLPSLREIFNEKYYDDLPGGILESFGRMFKNDLRLYVSPALDISTGKREGVHDLQVDNHLRYLYQHLLENGYVKALDTVKEEYLSIFSHEVMHNMQKGYAEWETMVPEKVCRMIKDGKLFDWCKH